MQLRSVAYTAWLITNKTFREEWAPYVELWQEDIASDGRFPLRLDSLFGERFDFEDPEVDQMLNFFSRWSLRSFLTWDLPVPMVPQLSGIVRGHPLDLADGGLLIFLPWHLLRDQSISLKDLSAELISTAKPDHLSEWLVRGNTGNKKMGYQRLRHTLALYIFLVRGLDVRYPDQLLGNMERIDQAFATCLERDVDSKKRFATRYIRNWHFLIRHPLREGGNFSRKVSLRRSVPIWESNQVAGASGNLGFTTDQPLPPILVAFPAGG